MGNAGFISSTVGLFGSVRLKIYGFRVYVLSFKIRRLHRVTWDLCMVGQVVWSYGRTGVP